MKCIIFQKFTLNYLFFLGFLVISIIRSVLTDPLFEFKNTKTQYFLLMYMAVLSHFLSIIPFLISKCLSKRKNENQENEKQENEKQMDIKENKIVLLHTKHTKKYLFKYTILVSIFDFAGEAFIFLFYVINDDKGIISKYSLNAYLIINTVLQYIASYILLKTYFYKHHWLSMLINIVCVLITLSIDIVLITQLSITNYRYYIFVLIRIIRIIIFAFKNSYTKIVFNSELLTPYSLLLYKAVYETVFLAIFSIPFIFIKITEDNIKYENIFVGFKEYLTGIKFLYSFLLLFCNFFYRLFIMIIIDRFSPSHLPLAHTLESFGIDLSDIIEAAIKHKHINWDNYVMFGVYIILFIAAMIHNEIMIINKWGLNEKTKYFLDIKLDEEKKNQYLLSKDENEDDEEDNIEKNALLLEDKVIE